MRKLLYILWQCSWGCLQSLAGAFILLLNIKKPHRLYHGAVVTEWSQGGSVSLGMFIFISADKSQDMKQRLLVHEYGHTVQSLILGPLYLLVIGLPSVIWAGLPYFKNRRRRNGTSYYLLYPERWANFLGERVTKEPAMR